MALEKEIPWCTVFLCCTALLCHTMVLNGNMMTSGAVRDMGKSVKGWSDIGVSVSTALHEELDSLLGNVTEQLTEAINRTIATQELVDSMLSQMGVATQQQSLLQCSSLVLLEGKFVHNSTGEVVGNPMEAVMNQIMNVLKSLPSFQDGLQSLQNMMSNLKPALMQVGVWVETFADKVQATVEAFGTTLDRVQKIFDHLMSQISPDAGQNADVMQHETFNLFDTNSDGVISAEDLQNCGDLYAIDAVKGQKGQDLIRTYDVDDSGDLDFTEFGNMVEDPSIVGIMATVLRAYAKRLSMVAGKVGNSRMRDDVATNVVQYFQLVCSKNLTKVGWISDMLTNATLPLPFTADVMIELALAKDDPNTLTTADVGEIVVGMMMTINQDYTHQAFDLLSTADHWESEGLNMDYMSDCVKTIQSWMNTGPDAIADLQDNMVVLEEDEPASHFIRKVKKRQQARAAELVEESAAQENGEQDLSEVIDLLKVIDKMPEVAAELVADRKAEHMQRKFARRREKRLELFGTEAQQTFLVELLHGQAAQDGGPRDMAEQALASGVPAVPETLLFAKWLMWNATQTANRFQQECFEYTGESSSALDAFNTQIQGMVKKLSGFIDLMKEYATPAGMDKLEQTVLEFASQAMQDIFAVVADQVVAALEGSHALRQVHSMDYSHALEPLAVAGNMTPAQALNDIMGSVEATKQGISHFHPSSMSGNLAERYEKMKERYASHKSVDVREMHDWRATLVQTSVARRMARIENLQRVGLVGEQVPPAAGGEISGAWTKVSGLLRELEQVLPQAIDLLKFSRKEVSAVSATLDSIFSTLQEKGDPIFAKVATAWQYLWMFYYCLVMPLTAGILFYGFWAGGFFGGPKPTNEEYVPPQTFWEKVSVCCSACCNCCRKCHDRTLCFWSFIIVFQVIVLLLFLVSLAFIILGGVQVFTAVSCAQIYILGDTKVCTETLNMLSTFLSTFQVGDNEVPLSMSCEHYNLKTCSLIKNKMLQSTILTIAGSFVAAILSFQMIFSTALLYERSRWRRAIAEMEAAAKQEQEA